MNTPDDYYDDRPTEYQYPTRRADPSPRQIAEQCARIQAGWSNTERRKRLAVKPRPWSIAEVRVARELY